jgi:hypothetical protein
MCLLATGLIEEGLSFDVLSLWAIPGIVFAGLMMMSIGTVFSALLVAFIGVPVAWALGSKLGSPLGLAVAAGAALLAGSALTIAFWTSPIFGEDGWLFTLMVMAYALPAGLFYRREVLTARALSLFAEPEPAA